MNYPAASYGVSIADTPSLKRSKLRGMNPVEIQIVEDVENVQIVKNNRREKTDIGASEPQRAEQGSLGFKPLLQCSSTPPLQFPSHSSPFSFLIVL